MPSRPAINRNQRSQLEALGYTVESAQDAQAREARKKKKKKRKKSTSETQPRGYRTRPPTSGR